MGEGEAVTRAREAVRAAVRRGAACWESALHMRHIDPAYRISDSQLLRVYDAAVRHSDRFADKRFSTIQPAVGLTQGAKRQCKVAVHGLMLLSREKRFSVCTVIAR